MASRKEGSTQWEGGCSSEPPSLQTGAEGLASGRTGPRQHALVLEGKGSIRRRLEPKRRVEEEMSRLSIVSGRIEVSDWSSA